MAQATIAPPKNRTLADLVKRLGNIPLDRIRTDPPPGTATEKAVIEVERRENRSCELVDGTLVEKALGAREAYVAFQLGGLLKTYLDQHDIGIGLAPDGMLRIAPGLVRIPDLSFVSWDKLPGRMLPQEPIAGLAPDLAVEILSEGNTPAEMRRKVGEYFDAGVRMVWLIDPRKRAARVYTAPNRSVSIREDQSLDGGDVLPGFTAPLAELLRHIPRPIKKYSA
jgi:Uma2 family endonuclease